MEAEEFMADPQALQAEARKEQQRRGLEVYFDTIRLLKDEKGFSLREIAEWLQERGVVVDHNAVWRTYSKGVLRQPPLGIREQSERFEQQGRPDAAMPWLG
jgi:hypothetical protein